MVGSLIVEWVVFDLATFELRSKALELPVGNLVDDQVFIVVMNEACINLGFRRITLLRLVFRKMKEVVRTQLVLLVKLILVFTM